MGLMKYKTWKKGTIRGWKYEIKFITFRDKGN